MKFVRFLILLSQIGNMKKLLLLAFLICSFNGYSQENNPLETLGIPRFQQIDFPLPEKLFLPSRQVRPSLSMPVNIFPENNFSLPEVNFNKKEVKRQVNLVAMMERSRYEKEQASVELESPMPNLSTGEKALIQVTNEIRMQDRSSNFDIYTGKKKIPAYEEMRVPLFSNPYHSRSKAGIYVSPYNYSSFLR